MRLVRLDVVSGLSGWRRHGAELFAALVALALVDALRRFIDIWLPNTAPYALAYPGLLIATLMGRLRADLFVTNSSDGSKFEVRLRDIAVA